MFSFIFSLTYLSHIFHWHFHYLNVKLPKHNHHLYEVNVAVSPKSSTIFYLFNFFIMLTKIFHFFHFYALFYNYLF